MLTVRSALSFDASDPLVATAAWSRIAEPGDRAAAVLIAELGAVGALDWLARAAGGYLAPPGVPAHPEWPKALSRWAHRLESLDPRRELEVIRRKGGDVILPGTAQWPRSLDDLGLDAPLCLWWIGAQFPAELAASAVALVGARAATSYGEHQAAKIAVGLADHGVTTISGGAFGIDAAAHRGSLAADGPALAVMAGGLDRFYPVANTTLLERVAETGAVIAEAPPGTAPMRQRFLKRNRLIAALAGATVVVEAAWRSGAINTVSYASTLLRPVGAVPGPVTSMASAGCHRLIRDGTAVLVTEAADVLELLGPIGSVASADPVVAAGLLDDLEPVQARVLDALPARAIATPEAVARTCGLPVPDVRSALGFLELGGRVSRERSGWRRVRARS